MRMPPLEQSYTAKTNAPISWADLRSAISPQQTFDVANIQRFINAVSSAWQEGSITDEEMTELIKVILAITVSRQVNFIVGDFFAPDRRWHLGAHSK